MRGTMPPKAGTEKQQNDEQKSSNDGSQILKERLAGNKEKAAED